MQKFKQVLPYTAEYQVSPPLLNTPLLLLLLLLLLSNWRTKTEGCMQPGDACVAAD